MTFPLVQAVGAPFDLGHSSCGVLTPRSFRWTDQPAELVVFIDYGMASLFNLRRRPGQKWIGWLCESSSIVPDLYQTLLTETDALFALADTVYTCDAHLLKHHPNFRFCLPASNLPWTPREKWGIHPKSKSCSMITSTKTLCEEHRFRVNQAIRLKEALDLFGGVAGSPLTEPVLAGSNGHHRDKSQALRHYMFNVAIQNQTTPSFWNEMLTDCFANGTVPIYHGTDDIERFFNGAGIIRFTEDFDPSSLNRGLYESMLPWIRENYERLVELPLADDFLYRDATK